jgi:hypothetical protein
MSEQSKRFRDPLSGSEIDGALHLTSSASPDPSLVSKVAIPRIARSMHRMTSGRRASKACTACQEQKSKCSGSQPCDRCAGAGIACLFGERKRDRLERWRSQLERPGALKLTVLRRLRELESQLQDYDALLRQLQPRVDFQDRQLITETIARVCSFPGMADPVP